MSARDLELPAAPCGERARALTDPLPFGRCVTVDGRRLARVLDAYPRGSTSYAFAHYRVQFAPWPSEAVAVAMRRVCCHTLTADALS